MSNTKYYTVSLPCKTYIRKYISTIYGEPVKATLKHSLGAMVTASLQKNIYLGRKLSNSFIHKYYTDILPIQLNQWQFSHIGFDFPDDKIHLINVFMESVFETHLFQFCDAGVMAGCERKGCIEQFASIHYIETEIDISFDGLKKLEYRRRKAENAKIDIPIATLRTMEYRQQKNIDSRRNIQAFQASLFE